MKKILIAALVAASVGTIAVPAASAADVFIRTAPPPPRNEVVPAARHGYVWAPGHWEYRRNHHVWVAGTWLRERRGYTYHAPNWVEHDGQWRMERGGWNRGGRDNDHDGVPNRDDAHPNNPNRG